jgi:hypothetical protein
MKIASLAHSFSVTWSFQSFRSLNVLFGPRQEVSVAASAAARKSFFVMGWGGLRFGKGSTNELRLLPQRPIGEQVGSGLSRSFFVTSRTSRSGFEGRGGRFERVKPPSRSARPSRDLLEWFAR